MSVKLQQLRCLREVVKAGLSISDAAKALHTSQPGVSKQIQMLEEQLGLRVFERHGKRIVGITAPGKAVLAIADRLLAETENLKRVGEEFRNEASGSFTIATTHTQARYVLPSIIKRFMALYPAVQLNLHQGNPTQVAQQAASGEADLAIATEAVEHFQELVLLPCYQWNRSVVVPPEHPLLKEKPPTLEAIARYPLVTYDFAFTGRTQMNKAFERRGVTPNVVLTAIDADVIKAYVELGLGVGIIASMAFDAKRDSNLRAIDASHLFESSTTRIGLRRGAYLRRYVYDFIELFAPHLTRETVDAAMRGSVRGASYEI
jgi:LysR family transcriptional regulator, cys regulon transcriptional activator